MQQIILKEAKDFSSIIQQHYPIEANNLKSDQVSQGRN